MCNGYFIAFMTFKMFEITYQHKMCAGYLNAERFAATRCYQNGKLVRKRFLVLFDILPSLAPFLFAIFIIIFATKIIDLRIEKKYQQICFLRGAFIWYLKKTISS